MESASPSKVQSLPTSEKTAAVRTLVSGTAIGIPAHSKRRWILPVAAAALVAAVVASVFFYSPTHALTEKDSILLTDFVNTTNEPLFDGTLKKALAVDLEQSPYLNVFSDAKARQTLALMGKPSNERVTVEIGREICQRNGVKALLAGSITNLGSQYVVTLDAINVATGDSLTGVQGQADSKEQVLKTLDRAITKLRGKLGEPLASIQKFDKPLAEATTSSLEALKSFSVGDEKRSEGLERAAIPFYKRAIELDPNFASAYARLGTVYGNVGQWDVSEEYRKKAFDLKDRASERERLYITAHHYADSGQLEKGIAAYELYKQTYPRDEAPNVNLAMFYSSLGEFEKGLENAKEAIRLNPDEAGGYGFSADAYVALNRPDEAKAILKAGLQRNPALVSLHDNLASIAFLQGDTASMEKEEAFLHDQSDLELGVDARHGDIAASRGQLRQALDFYEKARQIAQRLQVKDSEGNLMAAQGWVLGYFGYSKRATEVTNAGLTISQSSNTRLFAGGALVLAGENKRAIDLVAQVAREQPDDTLIQAVWLPWVQAFAALNGGNPQKAIDLLKSALPYDKAETRVHYLRGLAYLKAKQGTEAAEEFQKILALHNHAATDILLPMAHLSLGRAYALSGETAKSRAAYQDFFALWKDADSNIPILKEAKAEYTKLQ